MDSVVSSMVYVSALPEDPPANGSLVVAYYKSSYYTGIGTDMELAATTIRRNVTTFVVVGNTTVNATSNITAILFQLTHLVNANRGEMTIKSFNAFEAPRFSLNMYRNTTDALALVEQFKKVRAIMAPLAAAGFFESSPGFSVVALNASDTTILNYLLGAATPEWHGVGTASMGKVVNGYGQLINQNGVVVPDIWIGDNSIPPVQFSTHSTGIGAAIIGRKVARFFCAHYGI